MACRTDHQIDPRGARDMHLANTLRLRGLFARLDTCLQDSVPGGGGLALAACGLAVLDFHAHFTAAILQCNTHALTAFPLVLIVLGITKDQAFGDLRIVAIQAELGLLDPWVSHRDRNRAGHWWSPRLEDYLAGFADYNRRFRQGRRAVRWRELVDGKVIWLFQIAGTGKEQLPGGEQLGRAILRKQIV